jgi:hypothetical protein
MMRIVGMVTRSWGTVNIYGPPSPVPSPPEGGEGTYITIVGRTSSTSLNRHKISLPQDTVNGVKGKWAGRVFGVML